CPPRAGRKDTPPGREAAFLHVVVVGVRDQREEACTLDRERQLALVARLGAGDAARHDLAVLGEVLAQGVEILVVDLLDTLGGVLAGLATADELGQGWAGRAAAVGSVGSAGSALLPSPSVDVASSSSRRRRPERSGRSGRSRFSSLFFMI